MIFDNTIDELLDEAKKYEQKNQVSPNFISDWNPDLDKICDINFKQCAKTNKDVNDYNYLYSIDDINYKSKFEEFCAIKGYDRKLFDFTLLSNSTIALYLIFKSLYLNKKTSILAFAPCYFTSESALRSLGFDITFFTMSQDKLSEQEVSHIIEKNKIDSILVTDPIYGMGIALSPETYNSIIRIIKKYGLTLIIDYSYGNMVWNDFDHIFNYKLVSKLAQSGINYYLVDSLPKKLFLNGVKFSLVLGNAENISLLENLSLFIEGSISASQFNNYYRCYDGVNLTSINKLINDYIAETRNAFNLINSALLGNENINIAQTNSGIFTLIGLKRQNAVTDDINFAKHLIRKCGIFLTPHSRYHYSDEEFFYFRVNLLLKTDVLIESLIKLSNL